MRSPQNLHAKVDLPANEPLAELILVGYQPGYGPEVWQLAYAMKQREEEPGYWTTRVLLPSYVQLWPPEKGQPHTLIEFAYPPENAPPTLLELLRQKDPRLEKSNLLGSENGGRRAAFSFRRQRLNCLRPTPRSSFARRSMRLLHPTLARPWP